MEIRTPKRIDRDAYRRYVTDWRQRLFFLVREMKEIPRAHTAEDEGIRVFRPGQRG